MSSLALSKRRTSLFGLVAIAAAVVTGLGIYSYLSWLRAQIPIAGKLVPIVVAAQDIAPGTVLEASMLDVSEHPEKYLPAGALGSSSEAVGKVTSVPLFAGEAVVAKKLGSQGGFSSTVPPGTRAFSLIVPFGAGLEAPPTPGDRVDVIVTLGQDVIGSPRTTTVLRHKEVAAVGRVPPPAVSQGSDADGGEASDRLSFDRLGGRDGIALTIFVTPDEAQRLAMAQTLGRVTVVLGPAAAPEEAAPPSVSVEDLAA
ncbi:MAG TPA: Flp pilus assembly protein CpaB [Actinomycetota bacterium]|nr:Flp pilus assembly protein CpaB [Actinomycetota bacterium]